MEFKVPTAAEQLAEAARMPEDCWWRFGVLQVLDDYERVRRSSGAEVAGQYMFSQEPNPTGSRKLDVAVRALADWLGQRDGWVVPLWAADYQDVLMPWWFVSDLPSVRAAAFRDSPMAFKRRGIFTTPDGLIRV